MHDHVIHNVHTGMMECQHCGFTQALKMPIAIDEMVTQMDTFIAAHKHCTKTPSKPVSRDDVSYVAGFDHGCDYIIHEIENYMKKTTSHDAMVLVQLLDHLKGKPE